MFASAINPSTRKQDLPIKSPAMRKERRRRERQREGEKGGRGEEGRRTE